MKEDVTTKVTVIITAYNHERFIKEALDSVLMQETSFDYDIVILEDCSTDRTREIVTGYQNAYPQKIRLVLSDVNQCNNLAFMNAIQEASSPYLAILDGDDYWTSRHKLQKQVDYLDRHPECTICFHNVRILYDDGSQVPRNSNPDDQKEISSLEDLIDGCFVQTCSTMYRGEALSEIPSWYVNDQSADWSLLIFAAQHGKIGYINEVMGVYRQHAGGFWTGLSKTEQIERVIKFYEVLRGYLAKNYLEKVEAAIARHRCELVLEKELNNNRISVSGCLRASKWNLRVAGGSVAELVFPPDEPDTVRIAIEKAATKTSYDIQLNLPRLNVKANHKYAVYFGGRADKARSLYLGVAQAHEPWAGLGMYKRIELTEKWQSFEQQFVAAADEENSRIHFDVGDSDIPVEVTSVILRRLSDGRIVEPEVLQMWTNKSRNNEASLEQSSHGLSLPTEEIIPAFGSVQFGTLRRLTPVSRNWGFDRGVPIDRYYIENFLARHADDVHGHVLEIGDNYYTCKFGCNRVTKSDVLHVTEGNPQATIVADLTCAPQISSDTFDCIILTQTLQLIYDTRAAIQTLYRILKPSGIVLATIPGISQTNDHEWGNDWYWNFTALSARRLFEEVFLVGNVQIEAFGNVLAAISFLHGLAAEELTRRELDYFEPGYEVTITVKAVKSEDRQ